jgi:c-di-GMP-binding flagellar brake protein YcgR
MSEEKRRYIRWRTKIKITYSLVEDGKDEFYQEAFTENLSELGLQILASERLEIEQNIKLKLEFVYDSVPIMAVARVVYVKNYKNQYRVGLEFMTMDDFQRQRLKQNLEKISQELTNEAKRGYL